MSDRWPFVDPQSTAVISLKRIVIEKRSSVLYAFHDHDGGWQFLDGDDCTEDDAAMCGLGEIVQHNPTLRELAALPLGFYAVRESFNAPWQVGYSAPDDGESE